MQISEGGKQLTDSLVNLASNVIESIDKVVPLVRAKCRCEVRVGCLICNILKDGRSLTQSALGRDECWHIALGVDLVKVLP